MAYDDFNTMLANASDPDRFRKTNRALGVGGILAALLSGPANQNLAPGYLSGVEQVQQQQMQQRMLERQGVQDQMDVITHGKQMRQMDMAYNKALKDQELRSNRIEAETKLFENIGKMKSQQRMDDFKLEQAKGDAFMKTLDKVGSMAQKFGGDVIGGAAGKVTGAVKGAKEREMTKKEDTAKTEAAKAEADITALAPLGVENLAAVREQFGVQLPAEKAALEAKMKKDALDIQTKMVDLNQKIFNLQNDQLLQPVEAQKALADIERVKASTSAAYASGDASRASAELSRAKTATEGIESMLKIKELSGTRTGLTYQDYVGVGDNPLRVSDRRYVQDQIRSGLTDGYDDTLDVAADFVTDVGMPVDDYVKIVRDTVREYNKPVTNDQLLALYKQNNDMTNDFLLGSTIKFDDIIMDADKQKVINFAQARGYVQAEVAGKWINRNQTAADIKANMKKFKDELEARFGIVDDNAETLENEWMKAP
jgi:hypothetical protein